MPIGGLIGASLDFVNFGLHICPAVQQIRRIEKYSEFQLPRMLPLDSHDNFTSRLMSSTVVSSIYEEMVF